MTRTSLLVALSTVALAACERPTEPVLDRAANLAATTAATTTFSGEATVVQARVTPLGAPTPIGINLVETGKLPESGGALNATLLDVNISKSQTAELLSLSALVGHAHTVGQGKNSRAQATVASLDLEVAGNRIAATFLQAIASAACDAAGVATTTGSSSIADLVVNGTGYSVGTQHDQIIVDLPTLTVVANEQTKNSGGASDGDITVNALHVTVYGPPNLDNTRGPRLADVIIASAHADIHCGACTDLGGDFVTGGGWITAGAQPHVRKNFAVAGGYKNGQPWGHLTYLNKATGLRVKGIAVLGYMSSETDQVTTRIIDGVAEAGGKQVHYTAKVTDKGEPGDADEFWLYLDGVLESGGVLGGGNIQLHEKPTRCQQ